jgi:hypothetical protein
VSRATVLVFRPSRLAADVVFSAAGLVTMLEMWRGWKKAIFNPYRPELHYMRGPGPKWREKHGHAGSLRSLSRHERHAVVRLGQGRVPEDGRKIGAITAIHAKSISVG